METKSRRTYTSWEMISLVLAALIAPLALRSFQNLIGKPVNDGRRQAAAEQAHSPSATPNSSPSKLSDPTGYSPEFEKWWGGDAADLMLVQSLEGKFIEQYGVAPNDRQKRYIRETIGPAFKNNAYSAFSVGPTAEKDMAESGEIFLQRNLNTYFKVLLSFSDEDQLKMMRQGTDGAAK